MCSWCGCICGVCVGGVCMHIVCVCMCVYPHTHTCMCRFTHMCLCACEARGGGDNLRCCSFSGVAPSQVPSPSFLILDLSWIQGLPIRLGCLDPPVLTYFPLPLWEHTTHLTFYTDAEGQTLQSELLFLQFLLLTFDHGMEAAFLCVCGFYFFFFQNYFISFLLIFVFKLRSLGFLIK